MNYKDCPVCASPAAPAGRLFRCSYCGHGYRPYAGDSIAFHDLEYRTVWQRAEGEVNETTVEEVFHLARERLVARRLALIGRFLRKSDSLLDVGGGAGTFAHAVQGRVRSVAMTEVNRVFVAHCTEKGLNARLMPVSEIPEGETYDVVTAWHVLEHIADVRGAAAKLMALTKRFLIIEIPIDRGTPAKFDGHHHYFSDDSFQRLFEHGVLRLYGDGVQRPSRLAVFQRRWPVARSIAKRKP